MTHINLRIVKEVIAKVALILDGADAMVSEYLSFRAEMESEFRHCY